WVFLPALPLLPNAKVDRRALLAAAAAQAGEGVPGEPPRGPVEELVAGVWCEVLRRASVGRGERSEEHTSELQSRENLVCRLLLDPAPTELYTLSLHDALPILGLPAGVAAPAQRQGGPPRSPRRRRGAGRGGSPRRAAARPRRGAGRRRLVRGAAARQRRPRREIGRAHV